jgi:CheY-like chemotaxis protein
VLSGLHLKDAIVNCVIPVAREAGEQCGLPCTNQNGFLAMIGTESTSNTLRILLVEDMADDAELLALALRRARLVFSITRVDNEAGVDGRLRQEMPDIVLCDYHLPGFSCHRVLEIVRELPDAPPVVVVSRHISDCEQLEVLQQGAAACVRKDRLGDLAAAIMSAVKDRHGVAAPSAG